VGSLISRRQAGDRDVETGSESVPSRSWRGSSLHEVALTDRGSEVTLRKSAIIREGVRLRDLKRSRCAVSKRILVAAILVFLGFGVTVASRD